jgi:hypothetical protein
MSTHLPHPKQIRDLITDLLGRDVTLTPAPPFAPGPKSPASIAVYVDDSLRVTSLIACDLPCSAHLAAALALVPTRVAEEAIEAGMLDQNLAENLFEVLNVAASMFNVPNAAHLKLHALHPAGTPLDPMVRAQALTLGRREDLHIEISGYGSGQFSVVMVA